MAQERSTAAGCAADDGDTASVDSHTLDAHCTDADVVHNDAADVGVFDDLEHDVGHAVGRGMGRERDSNAGAADGASPPGRSGQGGGLRARGRGSGSGAADDDARRQQLSALFHILDKTDAGVVTTKALQSMLSRGSRDAALTKSLTLQLEFLRLFRCSEVSEAVFLDALMPGARLLLRAGSGSGKSVVEQFWQWLDLAPPDALLQ